MRPKLRVIINQLKEQHFGAKKDIHLARNASYKILSLPHYKHFEQSKIKSALKLKIKTILEQTRQ